MSKIVVLTPTFNREKELFKLYDSLKKQKNKEFEWLIIDDGSTDSTSDVVNSFIDEDMIRIKYIYQPNGGKARALNKGFEYCESAIVFMVVDSDDYLLVTAIETLSEYIKKYKGNESIGGFFFYYHTQKGEILKTSGKLISKDKILTRYQYNNKYKQNDGCVCYLGSAVKKYRYPEFDNENYVGPTVIQLEMSDRYKFVFSPKIVGVAEYLEGGLSKRGRKLRLKNPLGMLYYSKLIMNSKSKLTVRLKNSLLIWPYAKLAKKNYVEIIRCFKMPIILSLTYFPGKLLHYTWIRKYNKHRSL
ncbi:hypothetical protein CSV77_15155 [Sporosarcina sp. P16b]|uniref:glycosyltransferase family 2 protein n=1 Tax=Sporosarcina sp. P16b TaxID=2048261 RepID=UPI000C17370F|nr:glycosyltransferase family 2 protein [Sporosarcina sp. P16b]PIC69187.1 hypothetical protein CSV77_15155 [Sporosarcina sp. P16b]